MTGHPSASSPIFLADSAFCGAFLGAPSPPGCPEGREGRRTARNAAGTAKPGQGRPGTGIEHHETVREFGVRRREGVWCTAFGGSAQCPHGMGGVSARVTSSWELLTCLGETNTRSLRQYARVVVCARSSGDCRVFERICRVSARLSCARTCLSCVLRSLRGSWWSDVVYSSSSSVCLVRVRRVLVSLVCPSSSCLVLVSSPLSLPLWV